MYLSVSVDGARPPPPPLHLPPAGLNPAASTNHSTWGQKDQPSIPLKGGLNSEALPRGDAIVVEGGGPGRGATLYIYIYI